MKFSFALLLLCIPALPGCGQDGDDARRHNREVFAAIARATEAPTKAWRLHLGGEILEVTEWDSPWNGVSEKTGRRFRLKDGRLVWAFGTFWIEEVR